MPWIARLKSKQASCCCEVMTKSMLFVRKDAPDHCLLIASPLVYTKTKLQILYIHLRVFHSQILYEMLPTSVTLCTRYNTRTYWVNLNTSETLGCGLQQPD